MFCITFKSSLMRGRFTHIYEKDFMDNYTLWTNHGEPGVVMQDGEEDDDHNIVDWAHLLIRTRLRCPNNFPNLSRYKNTSKLLL